MTASGLMNYKIVLYGLFPLSLFICWASSYFARWLAVRLNVIANRDDRRRHRHETPLLGGFGFYLVMLSVVGLLMWIRPPGGGPDFMTPRFAVCFLGAVTIIFVVGVLDDWIELKALPKFVGQFTAATLILVGNPDLPPVFANTELHPALMVPVLLLWIVGVTNAFNMIDGLDGLCTGVAAVTALTLTAIITFGDPVPNFTGYITIAFAGACVGFLFHNYFPARIFLGDSGSLLIGFVLAVVSVNVEVKRPLFISMSVPIFVLGLPLLDVALSIVRRRKLSRGVFKGDRSHIHHRLQQIGLSHRSAVWFLWLVSAYLGATAFFLSMMPAVQTIFVYMTVVPTIMFGLTALYYLERRLSLQAFRFSYLFSKQGGIFPVDRTRFLRHLHARILAHELTNDSFAVVVLDCAHFLKEMTGRRSRQVVDFYMNLYSILKDRLRTNDVVARTTEHQFVTILGGVTDDDYKKYQVLDYLRKEIKTLQENSYVFQSNPDMPEGFQALVYPRDKAKILRVFGLEESDVNSPPKMRGAA